MNHYLTCCAPTSERFPSGNWGRLPQHNLSENIKQANKEMNAVSTKVLLPFFPPVCTFAPSLFSQVGLTILWNSNCQIYNFTLSNHHFYISTFTLQTWQVYIILRAAQNVRPVLKKIHWLPNLFCLVGARDLRPLWSPPVSLNLVHVLVFFRKF